MVTWLMTRLINGQSSITSLEDRERNLQHMMMMLLLSDQSLDPSCAFVVRDA